MLHQSHLSLGQVVYMLFYHFLIHDTPHTDISLDMGISEHTITQWKKKYMNLISNNIARSKYNKGKLGSRGEIIEIDESYFMKRKYGKGRLRKGTWVFGAIERNGRKRSKVFIVKNRDANSLTSIILKHISLRSSMLISDGWKSYNYLRGLGYNHKEVNHSKNFVDPNNPEIHTQNIESLWARLKAFLRNHRKKPLKNIIRTAEFGIKFKNRKRRSYILTKLLREYNY